MGTALRFLVALALAGMAAGGHNGPRGGHPREARVRSKTPLSFDAAGELLDGGNLVGAWQCGIVAPGARPDSATFRPFPAGQRLSDGRISWTSPDADGGCLSLNAAPRLVTSGDVSWAPGQLSLHPGAGGQYAAVRWTAPEAGEYTVAATFMPLEGEATEAKAFVLHDGRILAEHPVAGARPAGVDPSRRSFSAVLSAIAGDRIDFAVGWGPDRSPAGDTVGAAIFILRDRIAPPPAALRVNPFYKKHVDALGIPVVSSEKVPDSALLAARRTVVRLLDALRRDVAATMGRGGSRVGVMAESEVTVDIPEHRHLMPADTWNRRARGLGGTRRSPLTTCAEENLLLYPSDRYRGEDILIHEFAHAILNIGVATADPDLALEVHTAFAAAKERGLWKETYAATNRDEYWAEGVQSWFDTNLEVSPPNGIHNEIDTREELRRYDPALAKLIGRVFPGSERRPGLEVWKNGRNEERMRGR